MQCLFLFLVTLTCMDINGSVLCPKPVVCSGGCPQSAWNYKCSDESGGDFIFLKYPTEYENLIKCLNLITNNNCIMCCYGEQQCGGNLPKCFWTTNNFQINYESVGNFWPKKCVHGLSQEKWENIFDWSRQGFRVFLVTSVIVTNLFIHWYPRWKY